MTVDSSPRPGRTPNGLPPDRSVPSVAEPCRSAHHPFGYFWAVAPVGRWGLGRVPAHPREGHRSAQGPHGTLRPQPMPHRVWVGRPARRPCRADRVRASRRTRARSRVRRTRSVQHGHAVNGPNDERATPPVKEGDPSVPQHCDCRESGVPAPAEQQSTTDDRQERCTSADDAPKGRRRTVRWWPCRSSRRRNRTPRCRRARSRSGGN